MNEKQGLNNQSGTSLNGQGNQSDEHRKDIVTIFINDVDKEIHRGSQKVSYIKSLGNVPSTDILYLMPNYEVALNDNESVTIKGGERFKSSAPSGGSA